MTKNNRVLAAMSGGVDSTVAAFLLKEQGYDVCGVTMKLTDSLADGNELPGEEARAAADAIGIPHYVLDLTDTFRESVMNYFVSEYISGRTPNPCVICNRRIKWERLLKAADEMGAYYIATGHYAAISIFPETSRVCLTVSQAGVKDQTYFLYRLTQAQLDRTLLPLHAYTKSQVREIARKFGFSAAEKPDSQEICFIPDGDYGAFIERNADNLPPPGDVADLNGKTLGCHNGIFRYTVGQRKGLGIALPGRMYVHSIDALSNRVILADNDDLFTNCLYAGDVNFMALGGLSCERRVQVKIRYNHKPAAAVASIEDGRLKCVFEEPQRAVTPGQSVVLYEAGHVLMGGVIA